MSLAECGRERDCYNFAKMHLVQIFLNSEDFISGVKNFCFGVSTFFLWWAGGGGGDQKSKLLRMAYLHLFLCQ